MNQQVEKILELPKRQKIVILLTFIAIELLLLVWFLYLPKHDELSNLNNEMTKLQKQVDEKTKTANNLPRMQREYEQLDKELARALNELPNSKELPSLLTSITSLGKNAGLDFLVFRPKPEAIKDFYAEVPVDITVAGSYHSVANFFASVATLSRIVNINNVAFTDIKQVNNHNSTKVTCLATTFRFLDKKEIKDEKKKQVAAK